VKPLESMAKRENWWYNTSEGEKRSFERRLTDADHSFAFL
jgi:hypothetical protein